MRGDAGEECHSEEKLGFHDAAEEKHHGVLWVNG
jgi:hypothetical protein